MTKVLIYIGWDNRKCYSLVAPNGVKTYGREKWAALIGASMDASFQMSLVGDMTEKRFREERKVVGSFMVKHAK